MFQCNLCKMKLCDENNMKHHIVMSHGALIDASVIGDYYNFVAETEKYPLYDNNPHAWYD